MAIFKRKARQKSSFPKLKLKLNRWAPFSRAPLQLQASLHAQYFEQLFTNDTEGIAALDLKENVLHINPAFTKMFGYTLEEARGKCINNLIIPPHLIHEAVDLTAKTTTGHEIYAETIRQHKNGTLIPVVLRGIPVFVEGRQVGVYGVYRDSTQQKHMEEALRQSERRLSTLMSNLPGMVYRCRPDAALSLEFASEGCYELCGWTKEELTDGKVSTFDEHIHPEDRDAKLAAIRRSAREKKSFTMMYRLYTKIGELRWMWEQGRGVYDEAGNMTSFEGFVTDVTPHKKTEEALANSEERYALAARGANDGLWDWDIVNNTKYYSPRFKEILGYHDEEITNMELQEKFPKLLASQEYERMQQMIDSHLKNRTPYDIEYQVTLDSGKQRWLRSRAQAIWDERTGRPLRMAGSIRDITRRKQAEDALAYSKKFLHDILHGSPLPTYVIDMNHKILYWNRAMEKLTGRKASTMLGTDRHWEVFYPKKRPMIVDYMVEGLATKAILKKHYSHTNFRESRFENGATGDVYFSGFHGGGKWLRFMIKPLYDLEGKRIGAIETVDDIHREKIAERDLHERMNELKVLYQVNAHTRLGFPLKQVFQGVAKDLIYTCRFAEVTHARIIFDDREYTSAKQLPRFVFKMEEPLVVRGQRRGKIELGYIKLLPGMQPKPFLFEDRQLLKTVARTLARHIASRELFERYDKLLKKLTMGVFIVEGNIFRYVNPKLCKLFKIREDQIVGKHFNNFILNCNPQLDAALGHRVEAKALQKNGEIIDVEIMTQTIDYHGRPGVLGTVQDITQLKEASERMKHFNEELKVKIAEKTHHLEAANKRLQSLHELKDEFIAVTSHELRSPLTAIRGYLSFMMDPEILNNLQEPSRQYLTRAHHNAEALSHLVNNILDVSRLEGGRFELKKSSLDLVGLTQQIMDNLSIHAQRKKLKLRLRHHLRPPHLYLYADPIRMHQVFTNLLDNAIKYSKRGKTIWMELDQTKTHALIRIRDQGIGIPQRELSKIFDKFMQAKNASSRYKGGAGLGLFITQKIVEFHQGTITVESQMGKGTTFTIQLPLT